MLIINHIEDTFDVKKPIVTIGSFDGVHIAHSAIVKKMISITKQINGTSIILTFDPHPREVLNHDFEFNLLTTRNEKIDLLQNAGVDIIVFLKFTNEFSKMSSEEFIESILVNKIKCHTVVVGYNHFYGKNRIGNFSMLAKMGKKFGFRVVKVLKQDIQNESVSSSKIRKAIAIGNMIKANTYLGYDYFMSGKLTNCSFNNFCFDNYFLFEFCIDNPKKMIPTDGIYYAHVKITDNNYTEAVAWIEKKEIKVVFSSNPMLNINDNIVIYFKHQSVNRPETAYNDIINKVVDDILYLKQNDA